MINIVDHSEVLDCHDPFVLSVPAWRRQTMFQLVQFEAHQHYGPSDLKRRENMALRIVEESTLPKTVVQSSFAKTTEFAEVQNAIKTLGAGKALILTIEDSEYKKKEKGERRFASSLRRFFEKNGLSYTAKATGPMQVAIRRASAKAKK